MRTLAPHERRRLVRRVFYVIVILGGLLTLLSLPPSDYPQNKIITIKPGTYMSQAAVILEQNSVIRSPLLFKLFVMLESGHRQVQAGSYLMNDPQSAWYIAHRLITGEQDLPKIKVTLTEGLSTKDIAGILDRSIPKFDQATFLTLAKPYEGMLFPDTYYFYANTTPDDALALMRSTFVDKTKPLLLDIQASGHSLAENITMASIVEREATSTADRRIIAGILWRRIANNMPLQVDPPFYYILGKDSAHLTLDDLAMDSPYNLYKHTGLPPTPIDNPGLDAITATLHPTLTDYVFYLSGRDGRMHYAATLEGHIANRQKYLQ